MDGGTLVFRRIASELLRGPRNWLAHSAYRPRSGVWLSRPRYAIMFVRLQWMKPVGRGSSAI